MLSINDGGSLARALKLPIDVRLKKLLLDRRDQLGGRLEGEVRFVVVQPGDSLKALQRELGFSVFQNSVDGRTFGEPDFGPSFEWVAYHGFCFEMVFIFDDSGFAHVVLIEDRPLQNRELRRLCLTYASS